VLHWVLTFFLVAIIAGAMGFGGIAGVATDMARVLFFVFVVLFVASSILHFFKRTSPSFPR
jgi:uncharacterized membrane protein YtjA (UPF0391 family)